MNRGFKVLTGVGLALLLSNSPALACGCGHSDDAPAVSAQAAPVAPVAAVQATPSKSAPANTSAYVTPERSRTRVVIAKYNPTGYNSRVRVR